MMATKTFTDSFVTYVYCVKKALTWSKVDMCAKALSQKRCKHYSIDELSMGYEEFARKLVS